MPLVEYGMETMALGSATYAVERAREKSEIRIISETGRGETKCWWFHVSSDCIENW